MLNVPLIYDEKQEINKKQGINFNTLTHLQSIGLIQFQQLGYKRIELPKRFAIEYYEVPTLLEMTKESNNEMSLGKVMLTKVGRELAPICGSQPVEGFLDYVRDMWKSLGYSPEEVSEEKNDPDVDESAKASTS